MARLLLLVASLAGAIGLREPLAGANAARREAQFRYTPDPRLARLASVGHRSSLADLLWLKAIPDLSRHFLDQAHKERWLASVLRVVTDLEPTMITAYSYGAAYLELIREDSDAALKLLERGVAANPDNLGLRVKLAMAYLMHREDRAAALSHLRRVAEDPACDAITAGLCTALLVDEREDVAALAYWAQFTESGNEQVRELAELHLERTRKRLLHRAWSEFEKEHGRRPAELSELRDEKLLARATWDAVLGCAEIGADGQPRFARLRELELEHRLRAVEYWVRRFRDEYRRWPTEKELLENKVAPLPPAPEGHRYALEDGVVRLVKEAGRAAE